VNESALLCGGHDEARAASAREDRPRGHRVDLTGSPPAAVDDADAFGVRTRRTGRLPNLSPGDGNSARVGFDPASDVPGQRRLSGGSRSGAVLAAEQGQAEQADAITAVTAEVSEVLESGSLESLERAVTDLAKRLERDAGKRDRDGRDELVLNVYLWYLAIILAFFMYLDPR